MSDAANRSGIDFATPATAFWSNRSGMNNSRRPLKMRRFSSLSDAVRFLIEDKTERRFGYSIETDDAEFSKPEVDGMYRRDDFPAPWND